MGDALFSARLNIFSSSYLVSFTATGRPRGFCRVKCFALGQNLEIGRIHSGRFESYSGAPAAAGPPAFQARLNIFSSSYLVSFTTGGGPRGVCLYKWVALGP